MKNKLHIDEILGAEQNANFCENWQMICVTEGELTVVKGSTVYRLTEGNAVFFAPDEFHNICEENYAEYIFIGFSGGGEFFSSLNQKVVSLSEKECELIEKADELKNNYQDMLALEQSRAMFELFLLLCCEKENIKPYKEKNASLFSFAAEVLKENIKANISVSDLAERVNVSLSNLKRLFLKYAGIGVHEYYTIFKIALAKELLRSGNSVTSTAELTGFANQAYFSAAFKRVTGKTPKEYSVIKVKDDKPSTKKTNIKRTDMPSYLL